MTREQIDPRVKVRYLDRFSGSDWSEWRGQTADGKAVLIRYRDGYLYLGVGRTAGDARFSAATSRPRSVGPVGHGTMTTERMLDLMAQRIVAEPEASLV